MKRASIEDLRLELWLRNRNDGQIIWKTKNGEEIPIKDMRESHLLNAIAKCGEHYEREDLTDCAYENEDAGDR